MNSRKWVKDRTNAELLELRALLTCLQAPDDWQPERIFNKHLSNVNAELFNRRQRQLNFMERLDGKEASDDL